jgi:hypothetical protein
MSRDELNDMEQLDRLGEELALAGHRARIVSAQHERPDPAFAARLRAELLHEFEARASGSLAPALDAAPQEPARRGGFIARLLPARPSPLSDDGELEVIAATAAPGDAVRRPHNVQLPGPGADDAEGDNDGRPTALRPSVSWRNPARLQRWAAVGAAAAIFAAAFLYGSNYLWPAVKPTATAGEAVGATLVRGGTTSALTAGSELREGDEIRVADEGRAYVTIGSSQVRLAGGADVRLERLDPNHVLLNQLAGRVYHRAVVPAGGDYRVETAMVTWTAGGGAFDLNRHEASGGVGEEVVGLLLQNGLSILPAKLDLQQGVSVTILLGVGGAPTGSPVVGPISAEALASLWLVENAYLDAHLGLPLGLLADVVSPAPSASPTEATATEEPTEAVTEPPTAAPTPTRRITPKPTPRPTPKPTPDYTSLGAIGVTDKGGGMYTLTWKAYAGPIGISYYKICGTTTASGDFGYVEGKYDWCNPVNPPTHSWTGTIDPGVWRIKVEAVYYTSGGAVSVGDAGVAIPNTGTTVHAAAWTSILSLEVTATPAPTASLPPVGSLGSINLTYNSENDTYTFDWNAYGGGWTLDAYKFVYSASGTPTFGQAGTDLIAAVSAGSASWTSEVGWVPANGKYRVQAVGSPYDEFYVFANSNVLNYP